MRFATTRSAALIFGVSLTLGACSGTADLDDLASSLREITNLTEEQATCVSATIADSGKYDEDQINDFSDGETDAENQSLLEEFDQDVVQAIADCR